ncbi:hypothetical protein CDL12_07956 [Handroanthus impetiginosus]|uniref:Uncharacterized protein n=1 Tax=Handroanthus impetiginosus TaxID=429701 RepID=A0A2G9HPD1_9LAMI|nr:hypothetical protein CDL12_07956 [Handroanthus impetiginosus]
MASYNRTHDLLVFCMINLLLFQQYFGPIDAHRLPKIRPPAPILVLTKPNPPPVYGFRLNRFKKIQADAYRPTTPGNSPGMGHDEPPGKH